MTTYAAPTAAAFVSEREVAHLWVDGVTKDDAAWEDCDPCAVLQVAKAAKPSLTVSHTEAERLRRAAGYGAFGGTAVEKVGPAAAARYGVAITVKSGITDAVDWRASGLTFYLDGVRVWAETAHPVTTAKAILLDLGLGGSWCGAPTGSTPASSEMLVDWVRVSP